MASYAYLLEFIVEKIRGLSVSRTGGIYLPPFQLQTFRMDFLLPKIDRFFREELPKLYDQRQYLQRCKKCEFVDVCRKDAEDLIAIISYYRLRNL